MTMVFGIRVIIIIGTRRFHLQLRKEKQGRRGAALVNCADPLHVMRRARPLPR